jgi:hypothetical protein
MTGGGSRASAPRRGVTAVDPMVLGGRIAVAAVGSRHLIADRVTGAQARRLLGSGLPGNREATVPSVRAASAAVVCAVLSRGRRYVVVCRHLDCGDPVRGRTVRAVGTYPVAAVLAASHERGHADRAAP